MYSRIAAFTFPFAALVASLSAQAPIVVRGEIAANGSGHLLACTKTQLVGTTVNLAPIVSRSVVMYGKLRGGAVEVLSVQPAARSFSLAGPASIGTALEFTTHAVHGDLAVNAIGFATGVTLLADQALLLAGPTAATIGMGFVGAGGEFTTTLRIPNAPGLIGLEVFGQALVLPPAAPFFTSNVDARVVN